MSGDRPKAVVVDTMVVSWLLDDRPNELADRYRSLIGSAGVILSFQTVMELRYGAIRASWGELRRRRLDRSVGEFTVVQPDDQMISVCAQLRAECRAIGHALGDKIHDGDRWVAATAVRLGVPLVSHDRIFNSAPGLELVSAGS